MKKPILAKTMLMPSIAVNHKNNSHKFLCASLHDYVSKVFLCNLLQFNELQGFKSQTQQTEAVTRPGSSL